MPSRDGQNSHEAFHGLKKLRAPNFARRMQNADLAKLDMVRLRAKAEYYQIDTASLRYKWEYIDVIERHRRDNRLAHFARGGTSKGVGFTALPAEIRNVVYEMVLISSTTIPISYHEEEARICVRKRVPAPYCYGYPRESMEDPCLPVVYAFAALGMVNRQIASEVRTFLYANNSFQFSAVPYSLSWSWLAPYWFSQSRFGHIGESERCRHRRRTFLSPAYLEGFAGFLASMGEEGRRAVKVLELKDERERDGGMQCLNDNHRFFGLFAQCTNLTTLLLSITADDVTAADSAAYHRYLLGRGVVPRRALRAFASNFSLAHLPRLEKLTLTYTIGDRELFILDSTVVDIKRKRRRWRIAWDLVAEQINTLMMVLQRLLAKELQAQVVVRRGKMVQFAWWGRDLYQTGNFGYWWHHWRRDGLDDGYPSWYGGTNFLLTPTWDGF